MELLTLLALGVFVMISDMMARFKKVADNSNHLSYKYQMLMLHRKYKHNNSNVIRDEL